MSNNRSVSVAEATSPTTFELDDVTRTGVAYNNEAGDTESTSNAQSLPPADGGRAAWRLLLAAFVFEALLWGPLIQQTRSDDWEC